MTVFLRLLDAQAKGPALLEAIERSSERRYDFDVSDLSKLPGTPFAYWLSAKFRDILNSAEQPPVDTRIGAGTLSDFRFLRLWWEKPHTADERWVPFAKGGPFSPFYLDLDYTIDWRDGGRELRTFVAQRVGSASRKIQSVSHYLRPGMFWSRRSQKGLSVRALPSGAIFADTGPAAFVEDDDTQVLLSLLATTNSSTYLYLVGLYVGFGSYEVGVLQDTTIPGAATRDPRLAHLARTAISMLRREGTAVENSHAFVLPALLQKRSGLFTEGVAARAVDLLAARSSLRSVQREIDAVCLELYQVPNGDRSAIAEGFGLTDESLEEHAPDSDEGGVGIDAFVAAADLVSWCVGVTVGRFDARLATGEREWPGDPDPFEPLPAAAPGMLTQEDVSPPDAVPAGYPLDVTPVLVTDSGHKLDIGNRVRSVFDLVFGDVSDQWWSDVGNELVAKGADPAAWLSKGFFDHHLKSYSRARRRAPVLWPLGTRSGSYLVWLYSHRVTGDSLFRVLTDLVSPKLMLERRRLTELVQEAGMNPSVSQRKAIDSQERFVGELQQFIDELKGVTPLWHPDMNDGIVVVLAPLWRLFAHHKPWSKELHKHWESLAVGEYDWSQLAMRLWPERVIPKCAEDRSLAIAHGLEDVFWFQDEENPDRWHRRETSPVEIEQLITERTDSVTKAALNEVAIR